MKKVTLKQLTLINFRGHQNFTANFSDITTISGDNRLGKSTVFDAFIWLLFGKDQFDRKDFEITPIIDGKMLERIDSEVTGVIDFDNREFILKRILHQKWVRRRGTAEEVFDGCETLYYINDVPLKAGEYKARVDLIIEETIFKLITNPSTFLSLHWQKQREFLFQIAGTISDAEIASTDPKFSKLIDMVNGKSLYEFKKEISARKKKLKDDLDRIQPKIDQTAKLMPELKDYSYVEIELSKIDELIKGIDLMISDRAAAIRGQYDEMQKKQSEINELKQKQNKLISDHQAKANEQAKDANAKRFELENNISDIRRKAQVCGNSFKDTDAEINQISKQITDIETELDVLRSKWESVNSEEYNQSNGCLICPVFGTQCQDSTATTKHAESQEAAMTSFIENKNKRLDDINIDGVKKSENLESLKAMLPELKAQLQQHLSFKNEYLQKAESMQKELDSFSVVTPSVICGSDVHEWVELENIIKSIEASFEDVKPVDNSDLTENKAKLNAKRDLLKNELASKDLIAKYKSEISNLEIEGKNLAQQIADIEKQEFTIDAFTKVKIDECDKRINGMFEIVQFKLFDKTNDGNEFEACIPTNKKGVPISVTNTAERINAGLDIIRTLSNFYNVSAPIFCDSAESNNKYLPTNSQMIFLRVTKELVLSITNN